VKKQRENQFFHSLKEGGIMKKDAIRFKKIAVPLFLMLVVFLSISDAAVPEPTLILNQPEEVVTELRRFRMMSDPYVRKFEGKAPTRKGLSVLRASGSTQFSKQSFQKLLKILPSKKIIIIDLRQESHGFLNEMPVSWYEKNNWANLGKDLEFIEADEAHRLDQLLLEKTVRVHQLARNQIQPQNFDLLVKVRSVSTEKKLCQDSKVDYLRLPTPDHYPPDDLQIDRFVDLVKTMPKDAWIHLHCEGGMGRTTAFLCLYDMMHNAKTVSLEDIIMRQWLMGGQNFTNESSINYQHWPDQFVQRTKVLKLFYDYCRSNNGQFDVPWSDWLKTSAPDALLHK
jgi:protein-tyrosine phosphatase